MDDADSENNLQRISTSSICEGDQADANRPQGPNFLAHLRQDQVIELREELRLKSQELCQKNTIIRQLQERCTLIAAYERKIEMLDSKVLQLEKVLDNLELSTTMDIVPRKNQQYISERSSYILTDRPANQTDQSRKSSKDIKQPRQDVKCSSKQNRKSSLKPKEVSKLLQMAENSKGESQKIDEKEIHTENTLKSLSMAATSSKLLQANKSDEEKRKEIDMKFNLIKSSLPTQARSNKNIEEIYSLLSGHKFKREELAIRQINDKLETILNQSVRLNATSGHERPSTSRHERYENKAPLDSLYSEFWAHPHKTSNNGLLTHEKDRLGKATGRQKTQSCYESDIFFRPKFTKEPVIVTEMKMKTSKMERIINATSIDEILRARKCLVPQREMKNSKYLNKSTGAGLSKVIPSRVGMR